jgi:hypothetical protein
MKGLIERERERESLQRKKKIKKKDWGDLLSIYK